MNIFTAHAWVEVLQLSVHALAEAKMTPLKIYSTTNLKEILSQKQRYQKNDLSYQGLRRRMEKRG